MHKPESVLENETHLWDFEMQMDYLIQAGRSDLEIIKNKTKRKTKNHPTQRTCCLVYFAVLSDHKVKIKENDKRDKYSDIAGEL